MLFWAVVKGCYVVYGLIQEKGGDGEGRASSRVVRLKLSLFWWDLWQSEFIQVPNSLFRLLSKFPCDRLALRKELQQFLPGSNICQRWENTEKLLSVIDVICMLQEGSKVQNVQLTLPIWTFKIDHNVSGHVLNTKEKHSFPRQMLLCLSSLLVLQLPKCWQPCMIWENLQEF